MAPANPALDICERCPHPRAAHLYIDDERCRLGGCPCRGFLSPDLRAELPRPSGRIPSMLRSLAARLDR